MKGLYYERNQDKVQLSSSLAQKRPAISSRNLLRSSLMPLIPLLCLALTHLTTSGLFFSATEKMDMSCAVLERTTGSTSSTTTTGFLGTCCRRGSLPVFFYSGVASS